MSQAETRSPEGDNTLRREGDFTLFETEDGNHVLCLGGEKRDYWVAIVTGSQGDLIVLTDSHHPGSRAVRSGGYFYIDFKDDPRFVDQPHLFLANRSGAYDAWILPNGLPNGQDKQKKLVRTPDVVARSTLDAHH